MELPVNRKEVKIRETERATREKRKMGFVHWPVPKREKRVRFSIFVLAIAIVVAVV